MKNNLSQFTKDEILTAIESVCDYSTTRRIASYCEMGREKKRKEFAQLKKVNIVDDKKGE